MERGHIVGAAGAEGEEILSGLGDGFAEDLELDVAVGGVQLGAWLDLVELVGGGEGLR
jgi:hypothetical protein